jgi:hypothetical protein
MPRRGCLGRKRLPPCSRLRNSHGHCHHWPYFQTQQRQHRAARPSQVSPSTGREQKNQTKAIKFILQRINQTLIELLLYRKKFHLRSQGHFVSSPFEFELLTLMHSRDLDSNPLFSPTLNLHNEGQPVTVMYHPTTQGSQTVFGANLLEGEFLCVLYEPEEVSHKSLCTDDLVLAGKR